MAKERPKSPRARLFVALDLPDRVVNGIEAWGRRALRDPALRPLSPAALHITLAFLGYRALKETGPLEEVLRSGAGPAPRIELLDPVAVPTSGRPRLYALEARSSQTAELQARLQDALVAERLYKPEKRPFWPHVTVARVRPEGGGSKRPMRVSEAPGPLPESLCRPFGGVRLTLYRSDLKPQGAEYTPLAQVELPPDGQQ